MKADMLFLMAVVVFAKKDENIVPGDQPKVLQEEKSENRHKSIAIVGNGPLNEAQRSEINKHDVVIRFNDMKNWKVGDKTDILIVRDIGRRFLSGIPCDWGNEWIAPDYKGMFTMHDKLPFVKKVMVFQEWDMGKDYLQKKYYEKCKAFKDLLDFGNPIIGENQQKSVFKKHQKIFDICEAHDGVCHDVTKALNFRFQNMWPQTSLGWIGIWFAWLQYGQKMEVYGMNWNKEGFKPERCMIRSCQGFKDLNFLRIHETPSHDYLPKRTRRLYF